jgi:apolipoprotein N-acyltransferase
VKIRINALPGWAAALLTGALFAISRDLGPIGALVLIAPIPILVFALQSDRVLSVAVYAFIARVIGMLGFVIAYANVFPAPVLVSAITIYGLEFALIIVLTRFVAARLPTVLSVLSYPVLLTASERLLQAASPHGSFGALGYSLVDILPIAQLASLGGVAALSFLAALVPMGISVSIANRANWRAAMITAAVPVILAIGFGLWRLNEPYESEARVALGAIDALTSQSVKDATHADEVATAYASLVKQIAESDLARPLSIVLPEKVFALRRGWDSKAIEILQQAADQANVTIVAGFDEETEPRHYANAARVFSPRSDMLRYVKRKLIPGVESRFTPGREPLLSSGNGIAICKDLDFPMLLREYGNRTPLMLVPGWDFVTDGELHSRMAVLRGIENGFAVARAAAMGRLTVSDAFGRIVAEKITDPSSASWITTTIGLVNIRTLYTRFGDLFAWFMITSAAVMILASATKFRSSIRGHTRPMVERSAAS